MRDCPLTNGNSAELIVGYGARTLAPEMEMAFERHLLTCEACRELASAQRELWSALDAWTPVPVSANFDEKLYQRIRMEEQGKWWQRLLWANWSWRPAMPVAAACAALIAAFVLKSPTPGPVPELTQPKVQIQQVERALDDIDMLDKLGFANPSEKTSSTERL